MDERGSDSSAAGNREVGRSRLPWRAALVVVAMTAGWFLPTSVGTAQTNGAQTRACSRLEAALARVGSHGSAGQALAARLERLGCAATGSTTSSSSPGSSTTSIHVDCTVPGGGLGPCPTTTTLFGTTSTAPTTLPGGPTTVPQTTTLPPCPTTTTSSTLFPPTTVPCAP